MTTPVDPLPEHRASVTQDPSPENSSSNRHADASAAPVSRRRAFQLGIAGAVAAGALALRGSLPGDAQAADGNPVLLGNPNTATQATVISTVGSGKGGARPAIGR